MSNKDGLVFEKPSNSVRIKELVFDWLFICGYLLMLFSLFMLIYFVFLGGIPELSHMQSQLVSTFTTVGPIILIFSIKEGSAPFASWGKRKVNVSVNYTSSSKLGSLVRNALKFLPWQLGHMNTIYGIYNGYDSLFPIICFLISMGLVVTYFVMSFVRRDGRHFADMIAGSQVIKKSV